MITVVVQASSVSWHGGADLCMNALNGVPVVKTTIEKFLNYSADVNVIMAAPEFDTSDAFVDLVTGELACRYTVFKGASDSPLKRMVDALATLDDDEHIVRVDGLHFPVLLEVVFAMLQQAKSENLDCIKFPDDYPIQFTADIYRVGALRRLLADAPEPQFQVHPKYAMFSNCDRYACAFSVAPVLTDDFLRRTRISAESVYIEPRMEVSENKITAGDQLSFHYQLALGFLPITGEVLDIACGGGYGSRMMATTHRSVLGGDIDPEVIEEARQQSIDFLNVQFTLADVTKLDFNDSRFDAVVSMETIEHVNCNLYLAEISRVLKPSGVFILSTPQNSLGHIPVNAMHLKEYRLGELKALCSLYFNVETVIGIKQGCIIIPGSPLGSNMMMVCRKV
jgi:2-polyprenyl-3-methyl-5-hydroxy-6-metoxy-1,4-benzoquinol methylase/spore coat polysaccharide biosynthesis protein SpsF (cytidylyltransferase family)